MNSPWRLRFYRLKFTGSVTVSGLFLWSTVGFLIAGDSVLHCGLMDEQFLPGWKPCIVKGGSVVTHVDWITSELPFGDSGCIGWCVEVILRSLHSSFGPVLDASSQLIECSIAD